MATQAVEQTKGHGAHTQDAEHSLGLPGKFTRPIKIVMLGAGSGFTPRLVNDVLKTPGADHGEIALVDVDDDRLSTMTLLIRKLIDQTGRSGWKISGSKDRREVLSGADYLVNCIEVSGIDCV